jgi:hypothetical protein
MLITNRIQPRAVGEILGFRQRDITDGRSGSGFPRLIRRSSWSIAASGSLLSQTPAGRKSSYLPDFRVAS